MRKIVLCVAGLASVLILSGCAYWYPQSYRETRIVATQNYPYPVSGYPNGVYKKMSVYYYTGPNGYYTHDQTFVREATYYYYD